MFLKPGGGKCTEPGLVTSLCVEEAQSWASMLPFALHRCLSFICWVSRVGKQKNPVPTGYWDLKTHTHERVPLALGENNLSSPEL